MLSRTLSISCCCFLAAMMSRTRYIRPCVLSAQSDEATVEGRMWTLAPRSSERGDVDGMLNEMSRVVSRAAAIAMEGIAYGNERKRIVRGGGGRGSVVVARSWCEVRAMEGRQKIAFLGSFGWLQRDTHPD